MRKQKIVVVPVIEKIGLVTEDQVVLTAFNRITPLAIFLDRMRHTPEYNLYLKEWATAILSDTCFYKALWNLELTEELFLKHYKVVHNSTEKQNEYLKELWSKYETFNSIAKTE